MGSPQWPLRSPPPNPLESFGKHQISAASRLPRMAVAQAPRPHPSSPPTTYARQPAHPRPPEDRRSERIIPRRCLSGAGDGSIVALAANDGRDETCRRRWHEFRLSCLNRTSNRRGRICYTVLTTAPSGDSVGAHVFTFLTFFMFLTQGGFLLFLTATFVALGMVVFRNGVRRYLHQTLSKLHF
jgi:hypothetical protein